MHKLLLCVDYEKLRDTPTFRKNVEGSCSSEKNEEIHFLATEILLDILQKHDLTATFFVTANICKDYPEEVKKIVERGHEIGCHGWAHEIDSSRKEIIRATNLLNRFTARSAYKLRGWAAPAAFVSERLLRIIGELGYCYDRSIFPRLPIFKGRKSFPRAPIIPHRISGQEIIEFPLPVVPGFRIPLSGPFLRLLGLKFNLFGYQQLLNQGSAVFYFHNWALVNLPTNLPYWFRYQTGPGFVEMLNDFLHVVKDHWKVYIEPIGAYYERFRGELVN